MCIIVDANLAGRFFSSDPPTEYRPAREWLDNPRKGGRVVYGGKLAAELARVNAARRYLLALQRAGRARFIASGATDKEEARIRELGICRSNDPHVIALARLSGARTLCTYDRALIADFKDARLVQSPRGKVFSAPEQTHLLRHTSSCRT